MTWAEYHEKLKEELETAIRNHEDVDYILGLQEDLDNAYFHVCEDDGIEILGIL